ncbi:MAG TPA: 6-phosphogluconolactonase, partial [Gemmatimonadales bacterium]|nr:6-phosphogluconolactonase [Gemmatimonadales bacterium]
MIQVFPTPEALADAVARHVAKCAKAAISSNGRFTIALSGGSTPQAAYARLATRDSRLSTDDWWPTTDDWRLTHVVWGDERCVPPDDPRSNYRMAKEALLDRVPIPPGQIHRIRGEDDPEQAAVEYERELRGLLEYHPFTSFRAGPDQRLDLVLLGLGEDGHTASLFPGQPALHEKTRWVVAVTAHRSPDTLARITLTPAILNSAQNITFVVSGAAKAARLQQVIEGPFTPDLLPAQAIHQVEGRLTWMIDRAAASRL